MKNFWPFLALAAFPLQACNHSSSSGGGGATTGGGGTFELGDPIDGLTPDELAAFERGRIVFERNFKPSEGLGPLYNVTSCRSCHSTPVTGGSARLYRNFYMAQWGPYENSGILPNVISVVIPAYGTANSDTFTLEGRRPTIPDTYFGFDVRTAQRNAPAIFGVGLFEGITDATIASNSDPDDLDGDGISGRFNTDSEGVGRFGFKAQANNIEKFTRAPLFFQMGITSNPFMGDAGTISLAHMAAPQVAGGNEPTVDNDGVPDPEISAGDLRDLIAFGKFLAPPRKTPFDQAATHGEMLFEQVGCTSCHIPSLPSARGPVEAYTDLLLHEMGPDLEDGMSFGLPQASTISALKDHAEFRTQPLWGVSLHGPFLHDGRAETLEEAITMHGGEAEAIKNDFVALPQQDRDDIIAFLEHL